MSAETNMAIKKVRKFFGWIGIIFVVVGLVVIIYNKVDKMPTQPVNTVITEKPIIWAAHPQIIEASDSAWTKFYFIPSGRFRIEVKDGENAEVLFSDGKYYLLNDNRQVDLGRTSGKVRFRGLDKKVVVYIHHQE